MPDANMEVLQALARRNFGQDLNGALKVATGQNQDMQGICKNLYGEMCNKHMAELKTLLGGNGSTFNGTTGMYWETADKAQLEIPGDLDFRVEFDAPPASGGTNRTILSRWLTAANQAYEWRYNGFGFDELVWSTTGANAITDTLAIASSILAARVTMDVDDTAGNRVITWYTSSDNKITGTWTARSGSPKVTAGVTSVFAAGTATLRIGARADATGSNPFVGRIRRVEIRNGINGTVVANPDFRFVAPGTVSFVDAAGNTWTAVGGAAVS